MDSASQFRKFTHHWAERLLGQEVTVYPSYGYLDPAGSGFWEVPVRAWVHDNRDSPFAEQSFERWAIRYFEDDLQRPLDTLEKTRLERCLGYFIADDKAHEALELVFPDDPDRHVFTLSARTSLNGVVEECLSVPPSLVQSLTAPPGASWHTLRARTRDGRGQGEGLVRFLKPKGVSVVSDIDDTVRLTHVTSGKRTVLRNTFLRDFQAVPGMRECFEELAVDAGPDADVCFHYVSGSPWQLFHPLHEFLLRREKFPSGTFHMKDLRTNLLEPGAVETIRAFVLGGDLATLDQKIRQITSLMIHLPRRDFILIGDSGERDPEVYRAIQRVFPRQVRRIMIRDVLSTRLAGMEPIGAPQSGGLDTSELEAEMIDLVARARLPAPEPPTL